MFQFFRRCIIEEIAYRKAGILNVAEIHTRGYFIKWISNSQHFQYACVILCFLFAICALCSIQCKY